MTGAGSTLQTGNGVLTARETWLLASCCGGGSTQGKPGKDLCIQRVLESKTHQVWRRVAAQV